MYLPNASLINRYTMSEQLKSQKDLIGDGKFKKCYPVLAYLFRLLGALLTLVLFVAIAVLVTLIVGLFLCGHVVFGRKKLCSTKEKQAVPFCKQRSEGETSLLFIFLIFAGMHIYSSFLVLRKREILSQSKEILIQEDHGTDTEYLYE
jgi:hypothetical protein